MSLPTPKPGPVPLRFGQVDALRGLAAILVLMHHAWQHTGKYRWPVAHLGDRTLVGSSVYAYGYVGVDLFLVLSGFCLAYPFLSSDRRRFTWAEYTKRRFWRIYPPYFLVFVGLLVAGRTLHHWDPSADEVGFASPVAWRQIFTGLTLQHTLLNSSFWSLCLELRWYFLFPFVLFCALRFSALPVLAGTLCLAAARPAVLTALTAAMPKFAGEFVLLAVYLPVFVAGVWAAELVSRPASRWHVLTRDWAGPGFLLFLVTACLLLPDPESRGRDGFQEVWVTAGLFFFLLLLALRVPWQPWPVRFLESVGVFSYTLYLIHEPLLRVVLHYVHPQRWPAGWQWSFWQLAVVPGIVGVAFGAFYVLERPFLRVKKQVAPGALPVADVLHPPAVHPAA